MNEREAWQREEEAERLAVQAESDFLALGLPAIPCPDGRGRFSEAQLVAYALEDREVRHGR